MTWLARMLANFPLTRQLVAPSDEPERVRKHKATLEKADRVIEEYRRLDAVLRLHVRGR